MNMLPSLLASGAFSTPLPWQAEMSFLVLFVLAVSAPHIIDSLRHSSKSEHEDEEENQHEDN